MQGSQEGAEAGGLGWGRVLGEVAPERDDAAVGGGRLADRQRCHGGEPEAGEPPGDGHRGGQAGHRLRGGHHGDPGDGLGGGQVVDGGRIQAQQPRAGGVQGTAAGGLTGEVAECRLQRVTAGSATTGKASAMQRAPRCDHAILDWSPLHM